MVPLERVSPDLCQVAVDPIHGEREREGHGGLVQLEEVQTEPGVVDIVHHLEQALLHDEGSHVNTGTDSYIWPKIISNIVFQNSKTELAVVFDSISKKIHYSQTAREGEGGNN